MAEITDAELEEYRQLKAIRETSASVAAGGPVPLVRSRALLADGSLHEYEGAHPTHVDTGAGPVPVAAVFNVPAPA